MKRTILSAALAAGIVAWLVSGCESAQHDETSTNVVKISAASFNQQVLASSKPVVVDFWAPWCGPCRTLAPTISALADEYQGRAVVGKVNVDDEGSLAEKYKIEGIPAVLIFKDGKLVQSLVGLREKSEYQAVLNPLVTAKP
jgi:thioredoxin 1